MLRSASSMARARICVLICSAMRLAHSAASVGDFQSTVRITRPDLRSSPTLRTFLSKYSTASRMSGAFGPSDFHFFADSSHLSASSTVTSFWFSMKVREKSCEPSTASGSTLSVPPMLMPARPARPPSAPSWPARPRPALLSMGSSVTWARNNGVASNAYVAPSAANIRPAAMIHLRPAQRSEKTGGGAPSMFIRTNSRPQRRWPGCREST
jgi:hypothetical protein